MWDLIELIIQVGSVLVLLALGYFVGSWRERVHLASLAQREAALRHIQVSTQRVVTDPESVANAVFVCGEAVIATDYFKSFVAGFRKIIGGELRSYESLMRRARDEARLRLMTQAHALGATEIWCLRFDMVDIGTASVRRQITASVEMMASGTAIVRRT